MDYDEVARAGSERGELVLRRRRGDDGSAVLELRANGVFVMDTREHTSERALATAALALVDRPAQVLVGGLGLGYTLAEVVADPRVARCTVVEIEPALVAWMRDGTIPQGPALLADERIVLIEGDVATVLAEAGPARFDLVLLDVDNGPGHLVHQGNAGLYQQPFLAAVRARLRPGGVLVVWSADHSPALEAALREVFGTSEATAYDVDLQGRDERYWLHLAGVC